MNVFEDLIVELKEQNLLEETILDFDQLQAELNDVDHEIIGAGGPRGHSEAWNARAAAPKADVIKKRVSEQAVALQMVDHVLTGVERNLLKIEPQVFDDLPATKALHRFIQASKEPDTNEYFEAESKLLLEMESWTSALTVRDKEIPVAALRRYCETAQPPLSPQALFSLARFYRSVEPSQQTVKKFDFVVTRLFSKIEDGGHRSPLCSRDEIVGHLKKRYSDWAVAQPHLQMSNNPDVTLAVLNFEDFTAEGDGAGSLEDLKSSNFFERVRGAKEAAGEIYFVPQVTASAIECNIRLANRVTEFLQNEMHRLGGAEKVLEKFSTLDQFLVSDAVGRTFSFKQALDYDLGSDPFDSPLEFAKPANDKRPAGSTERAYRRPYSPKRRSTTIFGLNRWFIIACFLAMAIAASFYVWGEYFTEDSTVVTTAKLFDLKDPELKEFAKSARISNDMLYVVTTPAYDALSRDRQEDYLRKLQGAGTDNGYKKVSILNARGKNVAYASPDRLQINEDVPATE